VEKVSGYSAAQAGQYNTTAFAVSWSYSEALADPLSDRPLGTVPRLDPSSGQNK